jgi:3-dehydroquinate synthetase
MRVTPAADASRTISLIRRMGKLPAWPRVEPKRLIELMRADKKARAGRLRFVLTPGIGEAATYEGRDPEKLELILRLTAPVAEADPVPHG